MEQLIRLSDCEQRALALQNTKAYLIEWEGGFELKSYENILSQLLAYLVVVMVKWYHGAEFKQLNEVKVVAEEKRELTGIVTALTLEGKSEILQEVKKYRALQQKGEVYSQIAPEVKSKLVALANRTESVSDLIFATVIRKEAASILRDVQLEELPSEGVRGEVVRRLQGTKESAFELRGWATPKEMAAVYLLQKEGRECGMEHDSIDLKEKFKNFISPRAARFKKLVQENRKTFESYRSQEERGVEPRYLAELSRKLWSEADELIKELAQYEAFERELDGEVLEIWTAAKAEVFKEYTDFRAEVLALIEKMKAAELEEEMEAPQFPEASELSKFKAVLRAIPTAQPALLDVRFESALGQLKGEKESTADPLNELRELQQYVASRIEQLEKSHHQRVLPLHVRVGDLTYQKAKLSQPSWWMPKAVDQLCTELATAVVEEQINSTQEEIAKEENQLLTLHDLNETLIELEESTSMARKRESWARHRQMTLTHLTTYHGRLGSIQTV